MANLLIVDEDATIREVICFTLRDSGLRFIHAKDGNEALECLGRENVHAVLTDREVSGKDAVEILNELRKSNRNVPVIVMMGLEDSDADSLMDAGAFATLKKPFSVEDMKRIVSEAVPNSVQSILNQSETEKTAAVERRKKRAALMGGSAFLLALLSGVGYYFLKPPPPTQSFKVPYANISGLAWDGKGIWTCDWLSETVFRHETNEGFSVLSKTAMPDQPASGLAWDGKNIWTVSGWSKKIYRHGADLAVEAQADLPAAQPAGLYVDAEGNFWAGDLKDGKIIKFRMKDGRVDIIWGGKSPAEKPAGFFRDKKFLWTADAKTGLVFQLKPESLETVAAYGLPPEVEKGKLSAFASDGKNFWVGFEGGSKIYRVPAKRLIRTKL